jgi:hypothetical protein
LLVMTLSGTLIPVPVIIALGVDIRFLLGELNSVLTDLNPCPTDRVR